MRLRPEFCTIRIEPELLCRSCFRGAGLNTNLLNLLESNRDILDLNDINGLSAGAYVISKTSQNKPDGMLEAGILLVFKRGTASIGMAITYNSENTNAHLNIFGGNTWG